MATLGRPMVQDEDEQKRQMPQTAPGLRSTGGGAGTLAPTGGGGAGAPGAAAAPRRSRQGGFVGIGRYLQAQGGAGARLGEKVAGRLEEQGQEARTGIQTAQQQFGTQAQQAAVQDISQQIAQDPTAVTSEQYQKTLAGYTGPQQLADVAGYQQALAGTQQLGQSLGLTETQAGQGELLRQQFGRPTYTGGQSRLDVALMGATPQARERFAGIREALGGVGGELTAAEEAAATQAGRLAGEGLAASEAAQTAVTTGRETLQTDLQRLLEERRKGEGLELAREKAKAKLMGGGREKFWKQGRQATIEDVATEQQRARDEALARLSGLGGILGQKLSGTTGAYFDKKAWEAAKKRRETLGSVKKKPKKGDAKLTTPITPDQGKINPYAGVDLKQIADIAAQVPPPPAQGTGVAPLPPAEGTNYYSTW